MKLKTRTQTHGLQWHALLCVLSERHNTCYQINVIQLVERVVQWFSQLVVTYFEWCSFFFLFKHFTDNLLLIIFCVILNLNVLFSEISLFLVPLYFKSKKTLFQFLFTFLLMNGYFFFFLNFSFTDANNRPTMMNTSTHKNKQIVSIDVN